MHSVPQMSPTAAEEEADAEYVNIAADAGYTIISIGIYGLPAIRSMQHPNATSSLSTSFPTTNREPTIPACCRYCRRRFEDEARLCKKCRGLICSNCNAEGARMCSTCGELEEPQDADQIACAHCNRLYIQCNRHCKYCSQLVCEDCEHDSSYMCMKCQSDQQCEGRCWIKTGTASSSKDTPPNQEKDGLVHVPKRTTESTAEIEDADLEMPIAAFITQEATSST